jgi:hypothetical protein
VLITSLGVKRKEFNASRHAMELLEIFRSHFKVIDFNIDTGGDEFGTGGSKPDLDTVRRLYQSHRVKQDSEDGMISLPQILIDGVNIGDHVSLQALMDDGILQPILKQNICPHCFEDRSGEYCYKCKTLFQTVCCFFYSIQLTFRSCLNDKQSMKCCIDSSSSVFPSNQSILKTMTKRSPTRSVRREKMRGLLRRIPLIERFIVSYKYTLVSRVVLYFVNAMKNYFMYL